MVLRHILLRNIPKYMKTLIFHFNKEGYDSIFSEK
jgi:hypothetical protein